MPKNLTPEEIVSRGQQLFSDSQSARTMIDARMRRSNDQYDSIHPREQRKVSDVLLGQLRLFIPKTYNTVSRMHVELMETFYFDNTELVEVTGGPESTVESRDSIKALLSYRLNGHPINFYEEIFEATQDSLKNKVGILKVFPRFKKKKLEKKSNKMVDGKEVQMVDIEEVISDFEPQMVSIPPEDLFLHRFATWKDYWKRPMCHRYILNKLKAKEMGFENTEKAPDPGDMEAGDEVKAQRARSGLTSPFGNSVRPSVSDDLLVFEYWDYLDLDGTGTLQSVTYSLIGTLNGPLLMGLKPRKNTLPYRYSAFETVRPPIVMGTAFPEAHKPYGKDVPEITEALQTETNILRNQDREAAALALRKPLLVNRDAGLDIQGLVNRKISGVVVGEDISQDAVRELSLSAPIINTESINRKIDLDYQEATSMTPGQYGVPSPEQTATGVTSNQANANKKIQAVVRNLAQTLIVPALRLLLRLEQAYETDDMIKKIAGKALGLDSSNGDGPVWTLIQGEYDLAVEVGVNKQTQVNKYMMIMDRMNAANMSLAQLVQNRIADPAKVQFGNPMWAFDQMLKILKQKNTSETKIQAVAPPPQQDGMGVASQPGADMNPQGSVASMNPEEVTGELPG